MGTSHQGKQGNQGKLAGKVALITGGARGLGRGYALRLAGLGADIAIIDRDLGGAQVYEFERAQMTAETVTAECEALGVRAIGIEGDLTDRSATEAAVAQIVAALGGVDIAVCNAGGGVARFADERGASASDSGDLNTEATPADCPQDVLTRVLDINLMTCMYTCMAVAPHMKRRRAGKIVTVGLVPRCALQGSLSSLRRRQGGDHPLHPVAGRGARPPQHQRQRHRAGGNPHRALGRPQRDGRGAATAARGNYRRLRKGGGVSYHRPQRLRHRRDHPHRRRAALNGVLGEPEDSWLRSTAFEPEVLCALAKDWPACSWRAA